MPPLSSLPLPERRARMDKIMQTAAWKRLPRADQNEIMSMAFPDPTLGQTKMELPPLRKAAESLWMLGQTNLERQGEAIKAKTLGQVAVGEKVGRKLPLLLRKTAESFLERQGEAIKAKTLGQVAVGEKVGEVLTPPAIEDIATGLGALLPPHSRAIFAEKFPGLISYPSEEEIETEQQALGGTTIYRMGRLADLALTPAVSSFIGRSQKARAAERAQRATVARKENPELAAVVDHIRRQEILDIEESAARAKALIPLPETPQPGLIPEKILPVEFTRSPRALIPEKILPVEFTRSPRAPIPETIKPQGFRVQGPPIPTTTHPPLRPPLAGEVLPPTPAAPVGAVSPNEWLAAAEQYPQIRLHLSSGLTPEQIAGEPGFWPRNMQHKTRVAMGKAMQEKMAGETISPITVSPGEFQSGALIHPQAQGKAGTAFTESNQEIDFYYAVVSSDDLIASHLPGGAKNPSYPKERQPRQRERSSSTAQITEMSQKLNPERLGTNPMVSDGAPFIDSSLVVESGNGRKLAIDLSRRKSNKYDNWLESNAPEFGINPAVVKETNNPILVRVRTTDTDVEAFARQANVPSVAGYSATERAINDARLLSPETMAKFIPSDKGLVYSRANQPFFDDFVGIVPPPERSLFFDESGNISQEGLERVRNALLYKAFESDSLITRIAESLDNNTKNITNALSKVAPRIADSREAVASGRQFNVDISDDIVAATEVFSRLRDEGIPLEHYLNQEALFGRELTPVGEEILKMFHRNGKSEKKVREFLGTYLDEVERLPSPQQTNIFPQGGPPTKEGLLVKTQAIIEERSNDPTLGLFDPKPLPPGFTEGQRGGLLFGGPPRKKYTGTPLEAFEEMIGTPPKKGTKAWDLWMETRRVLTDRFARVETWERNLRGIKDWRETPHNESLYRMMRSYAGRSGYIELADQDIRDVILPLRRHADDFEQYWLVQRTIERLNRVTKTTSIANRSPAQINAQLRRIKLKPGQRIEVDSAAQEIRVVGIPTAGRTLEEANAGVDFLTDKLGPEVIAQFDQAIDDLVNISDKWILRPMLETGILDQKRYDAVVQGNRKWAPFDVIAHLPEDPDQIFSLGPEVFSVASQDVVLPMKGLREGQKVLPLFEALSARLPNAVATVERNKVARTLVNFRKEFPAEMADQIIPALVDPPPGWEPVYFSGKPFYMPTTPGTPAPQGWKTLHAVDDAGNQTTLLLPKDNPHPGKGFGTISAFIEGRPQKFYVPDFVEDAMKQLPNAQAGFMGKAVALSTRAFRQGATGLYIPFMLSNVIRDYQMAQLTAKYGFNSKDWVFGFGHALKESFGFDSTVYNAVLEGRGGMSGWFEHAKGISPNKKKYFDPDWKVRSKTILNPLKLLDAIGQTIELSPRMGLARKMLQKGENVFEAGWEARTGTIDFSKAGAYMKYLSTYVPFVAANINAKTMMFEAAWKHPKRFLWQGTKWGGLVGLHAYAWNHLLYPEMADQIGQEQKDTYHSFIVGAAHDERLGHLVPLTAKIPKGDLGQFFWNPIENVLDLVYSKDPQSVTKFLTQFVSDIISPVDIAREGKLSPTKALQAFVPPLPKAMFEVAINKNLYFDSPIEPRRFEGVKPENIFFERTPRILKQAGKVTGPMVGLSPLELNHLARGALAGSSQMLLAPTRFGSTIKRRFIGPAGGKIERRSYELIDEGKNGYRNARVEIIQAIREGGTKREAIKIAKEWNKKGNAIADKLSELGWPSVTKERKANTFQEMDLLMAIKEAKTTRKPYLQRRLGGPPVIR